MQKIWNIHKTPGCYKIVLCLKEKQIHVLGLVVELAAYFHRLSFALGKTSILNYLNLSSNSA